MEGKNTNSGALRYLLAANAVSGFAQGISMIAIPWYFINIIEKETLYGIVFAAVTFLTLPWSLYAGTLVDRYPRKNVFLALCVSGFVIIGGISLTGFILEGVPIVLIFLAFGATIFNFNVHYPTLYAFGQEVTAPEDYGKTNSLIEVQGQFTSLLAGAMAALLITGTAKLGMDFPFSIAPWTMQEIFLLDACTYLLAFSLILLIKYKPQKVSIEESGIIQRLKVGLQFLKKHPVLIHFGIATHAVFIVTLISGFYLMSMYVSNHLHLNADTYAAGEIMYSFGAVAAGVGARWVFRNTPMIKAIVLMMLATAIGLVFCTYTNSVWYFLAVALLIGITNSAIRILRITYLFGKVPNDVIGRVNSVFTFTNILFRGILLVLFSIPFFTSSNNVIWAYFISGVFILVSVIPLFVYYRRLEAE